MKIRDRFANAQMDAQLMVLKQMGANIKVFTSKACYVEFETGDIIVSYFYNANKHDKYFLSRIRPYPESILDGFDDENDVINMIAEDIKQFKNAMHSHNIDEFICTNKMQVENITLLEELFLYYNVKKEDLDKICDKVKELQDLIRSCANEENRVYTDKNPQNIMNKVNNSLNPCKCKKREHS